MTTTGSAVARFSLRFLEPFALFGVWFFGLLGSRRFFARPLSFCPSFGKLCIDRFEKSAVTASDCLSRNAWYQSIVGYWLAVEYNQT
jgi:hypothetical protein